MTELSTPTALPEPPIGDGSVADTAREIVEILNPADGKPVGRWPLATAHEVDQAVNRARDAAARWARTPVGERASALREAAAALRVAADQVAAVNVSETGKLLSEATQGVLAGAATLEQYAELGQVHRGRSLLGGWHATDLMVPQPRGVVAALTPWNDPVAVSCGLLGAALVTGNPVVYKPSERAPHVGVLLARTIAAHLPTGVLECLIGDGRVGRQLAAHHDVDVVAHVGSTATGRSIAESTARTGAKTLLENGGNDPLVVDRDVDPGWAAEQAAIGAFTNCGQICTSVERVYVHREVADEFLVALVAQARCRVRQIERPDEIELGPLVDTRQRNKVHDQVVEAVRQGARLLVGGEIPEGPGAYYPATVLTDCHAGMRLMGEETFGPVAPVRVVDSFEQGLAEAADDRYGLAATVLTGTMANAQRAWRELPVGTVKINAVFGGAPGGAAQPRRASGTGFGFGPELLDEMTTMKVVHMGQAPTKP